MGITYKDSGVDIDNANLLINKIKKNVKSTFTPNILSSLGGFASLTALDKPYKEPILVSGTDGVGTKLLIAKALNKHDTIGIDLVAMCVNDIITTGAKPLFFLDYISCSKLSSIEYEDIINGIVSGCKMSSAALVGGETAEMPDMYEDGDYDIAGFAVGVVEKSEILDGKDIKEGDIVISLPSSGFHSNGYSLLRKIVEIHKLSLNEKYSLSKPLGEILLTPTYIYSNVIEKLHKEHLIKGAANITGGGLCENSARIIPDNVDISFKRNLIKEREEFSFIAETAKVDDSEMFKTFNMGVGMILVIDKKNEEKVMAKLEVLGINPNKVGEIVKGSGSANII